MITITGIIFADVIVLAIFVYFYRQEVGLTVNGSSDAPIMHKRQTEK
jgi:hypothetical protein